MFKSYLVIAWRNLARQKGLSFISIFGLSLGIACFSLFLLYAMNEFSFDGFHKHADQIYRVYSGSHVWTRKESGGIFTPMPLGPAMKQDLADVEDYVRYAQAVETYLKLDDARGRENMAFADPSFFSVFSFNLKYGNAATALSDIHDIVLTEETARRLFGTTNVMGKSVQVKMQDNGFETFIISAVAADLPSNSYFSFSMLASFGAMETTPAGRGDIGNWHDDSYQTFVQLKKGSKLPRDQQRLASFRQKYLPEQEMADKTKGEPGIYGLEPLTQMHTDVVMGGFVNRFLTIPPVDPASIWILLEIATGVLLIACINFTTLAVGRSASRAREVGVRKVIGGSKGSIACQFLIETYLLTAIAALLGFLLAQWLLPFFNQLAGRSLYFSFAHYPLLLLIATGLILTIGLLAGSYPAIILSRFRPVEVLKSKIKLGGSNFFTRTLLTVQFALSIGLIIATLVIIHQLHYMQSKSPGFEKENVVVIEAEGIPDTKRVYKSLRQELTAVPQITGMAAADKGLGQKEQLAIAELNYEDKSMTVFKYGVDPDYLPVLGMQLLAGRNFDASIATDSLRSVLINETMMKKLGWNADQAIGRLLKGMQSGDMASPPIVIGVVKDINFLSMNSVVEAQLFQQYHGVAPERFFVRVNPGDPGPALSAIKRAWKKVAPDYLLKYNFLDENLALFYTDEVRLSRVVGWAGGISIFLACLGLIGLATLAAINRTKEIGIRKVVGASLSAIIALISRDFVRFVGLAFLIAAPVAWYFMSGWLQGFYYRIQLEWWMFILVGAIITGLAWLTVAILAARAGMANPVKSLRNE